MPLKLALPWMGRKAKDARKYHEDKSKAPDQTPEGLDLQPDSTVIKESRPFPDPDVFEVWYSSEVEETFEGKIWKKALQQEAKMQYRVFQGKSPAPMPGESDWEPDPNVIDLTWVDKLQKRLKECGTDLPDNSSEFTGLLEYRPHGLDTDDIPSAAIEDPLEDVETHTEDRWVPDYVGAGLGLKNEDPLNPQWTLRHSNHPLAPFPGEALKWESFVYDDGTTYEGLGRQDAPHGLGIMVFGNGTGAGFRFSDVRRGDKYEGEFQAGWAHGLGQFTSAMRGEIYIGEFFAGQRHGCGVKVNMGPLWWWIERGMDPIEAYNKTKDAIMRNIEFRTWYRGQELGSGSEDDTFVLQLQQEQNEHPYQWLAQKEKHELMLKQWADMKSPGDKAIQKMVEILERPVDEDEEDDPFRAAAPGPNWHNDLIEPGNYYIEELISELAEGIQPLSDHAADLDPDPMGLRLAYGEELAAFLSDDEQTRIGDALYESPANSIWDKTRTLASYWLSKNQRNDIDEYTGADIYKNIVGEHLMNLRSFETAYQNSVMGGASDSELQQLEQTLQYYFEQGQKQDKLAERHLKQLVGDEPRTHEDRWKNALKTRTEKGYLYDLLELDGLAPIVRTLDDIPEGKLGRTYREELAEQAAKEEVGKMAEGDRDWLYADEVEEIFRGGKTQDDLKVAPGVTFGQIRQKLDHLLRLTSPNLPKTDTSKFENVDPSSATSPAAREFLEKYQQLRAAKQEGEDTDIVALYSADNEDYLDMPPLDLLPVPKGSIPPPLDSHRSVHAGVAVGEGEVARMQREDYSEDLLSQGPPSLTEVLLSGEDMEGVEDPALYRKIAKQVAADVRKWNEAGAAKPKMKGPAGEDIEGDLRFETDSDVMQLCDLNEILGTIDEAQEVVVKARMFRWKPEGEVTLRFAQDAQGAPVQLMQDPLHYPHGTKWMAPGPLGQVHPLPDDPGLREELLRVAHNYDYIHSLYNFDWDPAPGTPQYMIDQRIKRAQELHIGKMRRMADRAADQLGKPRPSGLYTEDDEDEEEEGEQLLASVPAELRNHRGQGQESGPQSAEGRSSGAKAGHRSQAGGPWGGLPGRPGGSVFASMTGGMSVGIDRASKAVMFAFRRAAAKPAQRHAVKRRDQ